MKRLVRACLAALAGAGLMLTGMSSPASAHRSPVTTISTVPYLCPGEWQGEPYVLNYARRFDVTAPATVRPYEPFVVTFDAEPINPRVEFNTYVWDVRIVYALPAGARYLGHFMTGGSNLGDSEQTVTVQGDRIIMDATGPFKAGEDADLPNLNVRLKAPHSGVLVTGPAGTSGADPAFRWTSQDPSTGIVGPFQCYPDPATPVQFSSTTVAG